MGQIPRMMIYSLSALINEVIYCRVFDADTGLVYREKAVYHIRKFVDFLPRVVQNEVIIFIILYFKLPNMNISAVL